jgi:hypothetical protein
MPVTIKVSIQDEYTLVLQEDAQKGDLIDLKSIHETDIDNSTIARVVASIRTDEFKSQLQKETAALKREAALQAELREQALLTDSKDALALKEHEITALSTKLETIGKRIESDLKLRALQDSQAIEEAFRRKLTDKEAEITAIKHQKQLSEEKYKEQIRSGETALISLKEMRSKMSTKMIGESLELHCEREFNRIRPFAFPNAQFNKDNKVSPTGSKGDYIYLENDENGNEILSIMFEMKNEDDTTASKHKNKEFFKELDKDRSEKGCEFAILVSLLEKDNEYYDDIVTVHEYPNMYAIRPQHFITTIGFLRQGNMKSQELRREIHQLSNQNIDVTNFENNMHAFKDAFGRNYNLASDQFSKAIDEIDKTIDHLSKVKDNLLKSDNNLRLANNKATDLSIKRLTANSPSVAKAFEEHGLR